MKKLLFLAFFAVLFTSCNGCKTTIPRKESTEMLGGEPITEFVYDGCQYVRFSHGSVSWGGHKGSCNNPIHSQEWTDAIHSQTKQ